MKVILLFSCGNEPRRKHLLKQIQLRKHNFHFCKSKYKFSLFLNSVPRKCAVKVSWYHTSYCFPPCQWVISLRHSDSSLGLLHGTEMMGDNFVSGNQSREMKYWMHLCKVTQNLQTFSSPVEKHFLTLCEESGFGEILFSMYNFSAGLNHLWLTRAKVSLLLSSPCFHT